MSIANFVKLRTHNLNVPHLFYRIQNYCNVKSDLKTITETYGKFDRVLDDAKSKIIYNSLLDRASVVHKYKKFKTPQIKQYEEELKRLREQLGSTEPLPLTLKYLTNEESVSQLDNEQEVESHEETDDTDSPFFPYDHSSEIENVETENSYASNQDLALELDAEIRRRYEMQNEMKNWMKSYDNYADPEIDETNSGFEINYGTADPKVPVSKVPCGGCGALLHCKDAAIPGYIPSEIFKNSLKLGGSNLEAVVCQRCHFLKIYNVALEVQVAPDDYPKVLQTVSDRGGIVVLMVDLLDFPCSIWPGIGEIFKHKVPIVIVGNKVDLLPKDNKHFLQHVKKVLLDTVKISGFATFNIKHTALISAKNGYGVEELITVLQSLYRYKGDFYIVGNTNVGKSTLFNALIQSDFCKSQAMDLVQRATTSIWPGTTLNLLKFPIRRPSGYRQYLRHKRLEEMKKIEKAENERRLEVLRNTSDPQYASLVGRVETTQNPYAKKEGPKDAFSVSTNPKSSGIFKMGIYEKLPEFKYSRWCYDTPGVVQPDQIIHLLTTEELVLTLPKELIEPRSFCIRPNSTLFIGGLSRLDYLDGPEGVRLTVFASEHLPITVCKTEDAENLYEELLGTPLFKVPKGGEDRLAKWPKLAMAKEFSVTGFDWRISVIDVVLSNSGWIAITGKTGHRYNFRAWTPEKRGCHLRECLLPRAIALVGPRFKRSVAYNKHKFYLKQA